MIKFDINLMRSAYVYITKITTDYVYVVSHRTGEPYKVSQSVKAAHHGREVYKIKIHRSVSKAFFKHNAMREFSKPRLASLNYYGDDIVSIEIQMYSFYIKGFQDPMKWKSNFSKVHKELEKTILDQKEVYINGQEIYWLHDKEEQFNSYNLTVDSSFRLHRVSYVNLAKMGLNLEHRKNTQLELANENQVDESGDLDETRNTAMLIVSEGKVMAYYPNAQYPSEQQICVYSPVLKNKNVGSGFSQKKTKKDEDIKVFDLTSTTNPCYVNIQFVLKAAKTIGGLYGHDAVDFLDIPSIIAQTGEINFHNIDEHSRRNTPIEMSATESLAWLMSFIYTEKNLNHQRDLSAMFRYIINFGLVFRDKIEVTTLEGVDGIPLLEVPMDLLANNSTITNNPLFN